MDPLTLTAALAEARAAGVTARLVVGLLSPGRSYLLGLTTSDAEPRLEKGLEASNFAHFANWS